MYRFYGYPKCSTCKNAWKNLKEQQIEAIYIDIKEQTPTKEEIRKLYQKSGLFLRRFFNTSGLRYRELSLKERLAQMSEEEMLSLLASDGMLIKRPILETETQVIVGYPKAGYSLLEEVNR